MQETSETGKTVKGLTIKNRQDSGNVNLSQPQAQHHHEIID